MIDNPAPDRSTVHRRLQRLFQERGVKPDDLVAGDNFRLSRDITAHVLFPPRIFSSRSADDQTYVIQVSIAPSTSVLFMSDSGVETEERFLANGLISTVISSLKDSIIPEIPAPALFSMLCGRA